MEDAPDPVRGPAGTGGSLCSGWRAGKSPGGAEGCPDWETDRQVGRTHTTSPPFPAARCPSRCRCRRTGRDRSSGGVGTFDRIDERVHERAVAQRAGSTVTFHQLTCSSAVSSHLIFTRIVFFLYSDCYLTNMVTCESLHFSKNPFFYLVHSIEEIYQLILSYLL